MHRGAVHFLSHPLGDHPSHNYNLTITASQMPLPMHKVQTEFHPGLGFKRFAQKMPLLFFPLSTNNNTSKAHNRETQQAFFPTHNKAPTSAKLPSYLKPQTQLITVKSWKQWGVVIRTQTQWSMMISFPRSNRRSVTQSPM